MQGVELVSLGLQVLSILITVVGLLAGVWAFKKITENHLAHIDIDLKKISKDVGQNTKNISDLTSALSYLKGFLDKKK